MSESVRDAVVVGYDGSVAARLALYWGVQEAASRSTPLWLVNVFRWPLPELAGLGGLVKPLDRARFRAAAMTELDTAVAHCAQVARGVEVWSDVVDGEPVAVLGDLAREAAVLVLGSSGQGSVYRVLVGATSAELARRTNTPLVVVRGNTRLPIDNHRKHVVVGVDDSPASRRALEFAFDFAERHGTDLVAVHAWCDLPLEALATEIDEVAARDKAEALLTATLAGPAGQYPKVQVRPIVTLDRPGQALLDESRGAALMVVGDHGRAQSANVPLGSVSHAVLHYADCAVVVVH